jgi:outer membrane protein TolC
VEAGIHDRQARGTNSTGFLRQEGSWYLGVAASWTLWDGGERGHVIDAAAAAVAEAEAEVAEVERTLQRTLAQLLAAARTSRGNLALCRRRLELGEAAARETLSAYDAGLATELELRTAQGQVAVARAQLASDATLAESDAVRLLHQLGTLEKTLGGR